MRASAERLHRHRRRRCRRRSGSIKQLRDDPDVADVVAIPAPLRVRAVDTRREEAALIEFADELNVVVSEGRGILLERPLHVEEPEVQIVGSAKLAIGSVVDADRFELLGLLWKTG